MQVFEHKLVAKRAPSWYNQLKPEENGGLCMKIRGIAALPAALLLLLPQRVLAMAEDAPFAFRGAERIAAYWVLGVCSAAKPTVSLKSPATMGLKKRGWMLSAPVPGRSASSTSPRWL